jgi:2Fe-2S ferredoxin
LVLAPDESLRFAIVAECGNSATCATCHVYVEGGPVDQVPSVNSLEAAMRDSAVCERNPNSRLGCQIKMMAALDGLIVRVAERQL